MWSEGTYGYGTTGYGGGAAYDPSSSPTWWAAGTYGYGTDGYGNAFDPSSSPAATYGLGTTGYGGGLPYGAMDPQGFPTANGLPAGALDPQGFPVPPIRSGGTATTPRPAPVSVPRATGGAGGLLPLPQMRPGGQMIPFNAGTYPGSFRNPMAPGIAPGAAPIAPGAAPAAGGLSSNTMLLIGAAAVIALAAMSDKKRAA